MTLRYLLLKRLIMDSCDDASNSQKHTLNFFSASKKCFAFVQQHRKCFSRCLETKSERSFLRTCSTSSGRSLSKHFGCNESQLFELLPKNLEWRNRHLPRQRWNSKSLFKVWYNWKIIVPLGSLQFYFSSVCFFWTFFLLMQQSGTMINLWLFILYIF